MPAYFLIGPDMTLVRAHYGKELGDHLPIEDIERSLAVTS